MLRQSLSLDPYVRGFNEVESSDLYERWRLRPEPEIRSFLRKQPAKVLLKPIMNVIDRPVAEFLDEFSDYETTPVWIYRDPIAVYASRARRWAYKRDVDQFLREWNRMNRSALEVAGRRVRVVRYDDLVVSRKAFQRLCKKLRVRGEYLFRPDRSSAYDELEPDTIEKVRSESAETLAALDKARTIIPPRDDEP